MKVKICGITNTAETEFINKYKPDFVGIVMFFEKSRRNTEPDMARKIIENISNDIKKVAVTVSPTKEQIKVIETLGFDYIQIHGHVDDDIITTAGLPVWKAFNVTDMDMLPHYKSMVNVAGYVFDAGQPGSGKTFDWNSITEIKRDERLFILAGGLKPCNVESAIDVAAPDVVDVSSGVEYTDRPGKDENKVREFIYRSRHIPS